MVEVAVIVGIVLGAVVLLVAFHRADSADRRREPERRGGGAVIGSLDEVFSPARHEAQLEMEQQHRLPQPAPVPGDPPGMRIVTDDDGIPQAIRLHPEDGEPRQDPGG